MVGRVPLYLFHLFLLKFEFLPQKAKTKKDIILDFDGRMAKEVALGSNKFVPCLNIYLIWWAL